MILKLPVWFTDEIVLKNARKFWKLVSVRGSDECWPWIGYCEPKGYGKFMPTRLVCTRTHRFAYALKNGVTGMNGFEVMHTCDNRPCCNPKHLKLGTQLDNIRDAVSKGRMRPVHGSKHRSAKLTESDVEQLIIKFRGVTEKERSLEIKKTSTRFGVRTESINAALRGSTWRRVHQKL